MNLVQFAVSLFSSGISTRVNGQLDSIREAAKADAALVTDAYLDSFEQAVTDRLAQRQARMMGLPDHSAGNSAEDVGNVSGDGGRRAAPVRVISAKPVSSKSKADNRKSK